MQSLFKKGIFDLKEDFLKNNLYIGYLNYINGLDYKNKLNKRIFSIGTFLEIDLLLKEIILFLEKSIFKVIKYNQNNRTSEEINILSGMEEFIRNRLSPFNSKYNQLLLAIISTNDIYEKLKFTYEGTFENIHTKRLIIENIKQRKKTKELFVHANKLLKWIEKLKENLLILTNFIKEYYILYNLKFFNLENSIFYLTNNNSDICITFLTKENKDNVLYEINFNYLYPSTKYSYIKEKYTNKEITSKEFQNKLPKKLVEKLFLFKTLNI